MISKRFWIGSRTISGYLVSFSRKQLWPRGLGGTAKRAVLDSVSLCLRGKKNRVGILRVVLIVCNAFMVAGGVTNPVLAESLIPEARVMDQNPVQMGNYQVYFSAFNSTFIPPGIAEQYNLRRGERYGIVNIAIRNVSSGDPGKAVTGVVKGHTMNLLTQKSSLNFAEINEGSAIYYLADFTFSDEELLRFVIDVKPQGSSRSETLRFEQTLYHAKP